MAAAKIIGNHGPYMDRSQGVNVTQVPNSTLNWVAVVGKSGDVAYVRSAGFNAHDTKLSYFVQSKTGATVEFTLHNEAEAADPASAVQANVAWGNSITAGTDIQAVVDAKNVPIGFTVAKVTLTADGVCYIVGR